MKNNNGQGLLDTSVLDFGQVFGDYHLPCDYTPVKDSVKKFIAIVAGLMGRDVEEEELMKCERMLRKQYTEWHPSSQHDKDERVYSTPWVTSQGIPICIRIGLIKRTSIVIEGALKKIILFEICTPSGEPLGTMRTLPWLIVNHKEIANAVRAVMHCRFQSELIGSTLAYSWMKSGAREELPCTIHLGETPMGNELSIRFNPVNMQSLDGIVHAKASLVVNGEEFTLQALQPPLFRRISPECFDGSALDAFNDMLGHKEFPLYNDWLSTMKSRYDYLWSFQRRYPGQEGIIPVTLQGGIPAEVFHSGAWTDDGEAVYGLCRDRAPDGRWKTIYWVYADHLRGVGASRLPAAPNWNLEREPFDAQVPTEKLSRHVLHHASRWAPKEFLTGVKDELGFDVFVSVEQREKAFVCACEELALSIAYAIANPEEVGYGYYNSSVDLAKGDYSPITIFLPGFFAEEDGKKTPRAVFVLRLADRLSHPRYEIPTILPVSYVRRSIVVLGLEPPSWVSGDIGKQANIAKETRLVA